MYVYRIIELRNNSYASGVLIAIGNSYTFENSNPMPL